MKNFITFKIYPEPKYYFNVFIFDTYKDMHNQFKKVYGFKPNRWMRGIARMYDEPGYDIGDIYLSQDTLDTRTVIHEIGHCLLYWIYRRKIKISKPTRYNKTHERICNALDRMTVQFEKKMDKYK